MGLESHQLSIATKNCNESINSKPKKLKGVGKLTVKDTVQLIKSEIEIQEQKPKMALIGHCECSLAPQHKQFGVPEEFYYKMNPEKEGRVVCACVCVCSSTMKTFSNCKMYETYFRGADQ